jgi:hypothetical protein
MLQRYLDVPANTKLLYLRAQGFFDTGAGITGLAARHPRVRRALDEMHAKVIQNPDNMHEWDPTPPGAVAAAAGQHQPTERQRLPNGWPNMREVVGLFEAVSRAIHGMPNVHRVDGRVVNATRHARTSTWNVQMQPSTNGAAISETVDCTANALVMCLGGTPRVLPDLRDALDRLPSNVRKPVVLDSEQGLHPQTLAAAVSAAAAAAAAAVSAGGSGSGGGGRTRPNIAVVGNSHTAALVLRNLDEALGYGFPDVTVHAREPVMLAEWLDDPGTYKYTAHGLKGLAASFALDDLAKGEQSLLGIGGTGMPMADLWTRLHDGHYGLVISCCGFEYNRIPDLYEIVSDAVDYSLTEKTSRIQIQSDLLQFDPKTASLDAGRQLYQSGMTSPEYFVDNPDAALPVTALSGGEETQVEGWSGQRLLSWAFFNKRAAQIVDEIVKQDDSGGQ